MLPNRLMILKGDVHLPEKAVRPRITKKEALIKLREEYDNQQAGKFEQEEGSNEQRHLSAREEENQSCGEPIDYVRKTRETFQKFRVIVNQDTDYRPNPTGENGKPAVEDLIQEFYERPDQSAPSPDLFNAKKLLEKVRVQEDSKKVFRELLEIFLADDSTPLGKIKLREWEVVRLRLGKGLTLQEVGAKLNLTRERVRQIEVKFFEKLRYRKQVKLVIQDLNDIITQAGGVATPQQIFIEMGIPEAKIDNQINPFLDLLTKVTPAYLKIHYDTKLQLVTNKGPEMLESLVEEAKYTISQYCPAETTILKTDLRKCPLMQDRPECFIDTLFDLLISTNFITKNVSGLWVTEQGSLHERYAKIFKECFPDGLGIYRKSNELYHAVCAEWPANMPLPDIRSIQVRLVDGDDILLWRRGFYIHRDCVEIDEHALNKVRQRCIELFESGTSTFLIDRVFNELRDELVVGGIETKYALYSLLRILRDPRIALDRFPNVRDKLSKGERTSPEQELEEFVQARSGEISHDEAIHEFCQGRGWPRYRLDFRISSSKSLISDGNKIIHINRLQVNETALNQFCQYLEDKLRKYDGAISLRIATSERPVLWEELGFPSMKIAWKILKHKFSDKFSFKPPFYILPPEELSGTRGEEIKKYIKEKGRGVRYELLIKEFTVSRGWPRNTMDHALQSDSIVRLAKKDYCHIDNLHWNDDKQENLEELCERLLSHEWESLHYPFMAARKIIETSLGDLPELSGYDWSPHLLLDLIVRTDRLFSVGGCILLQTNPAGIETEDDLVGLLLAQEFQGAERDEILADFLRGKKLIHTKGIPENFFYDGSSISKSGNSVISLTEIGRKKYGQFIKTF